MFVCCNPTYPFLTPLPKTLFGTSGKYFFWPHLHQKITIFPLCSNVRKKICKQNFFPTYLPNQKLQGSGTANNFYAPPPESGGVLCYTLRNFECPSVRPSVCPSVRPSVSAHHHSCIGNSSYSFRPILLKLYRCFKDGLKICILFFQNPEIIFYHFFPIFNLDIFRALILQICIWSMYLVSATPPTVFGESF